MKNKVHLISIVFLVFLATGLKAQTPTDTLQSRAHYVEARPTIFLQAGVMGNFVNRSSLETPGTPGFSGGVGFRKQLGEDFFILLQVNYQHKYFIRMLTTVYEPLINSDLLLTTSCSFDEIECPIIVGSSFAKVEMGLGLAPSYLLHSILNQTVSGSPLIDDNIRARYNRYNTPFTAYFYLTNISPCIYLGLPLSKNIQLTYLFSFELVKNPINPYSYIQSYQFIQNKLSITFKLYHHEKNINPK